jgi:hypothetical protein
LEFAGGFADEEGEFFDRLEVEVGGEVFLEVVEGGTFGPELGRGEFFEPGGGGGEEETTTGFDEGGKAGEELEGIGEAADQVGGMDDVELAEVGAESHGVAGFEKNASGVGVVGATGDEWGGEVAFVVAAVGMVTVVTDGGGGLDEGHGVVDGDDFVTGFGEFDGGAADGAAEVEGARVFGGVLGGEFGGVGGEEEGVRWGAFWGGDFFGSAVVEKEVLVEEGGGLVEGGHGLEVFSRRCSVFRTEED